MCIYLILFFALLPLNIDCVSNDCVTVETKVGHICGVKVSDDNYVMYLGIPYGKVDENNPFAPSTPYPNFDQLFEASDDSSRCPHIEEITGDIVGSLDCLRLNVFVPNTNKTRLPVMVLIHGGGYSTGYASKHIYGPKYLVRHDVILVTFNYRLGPYGFMCLHIPTVPGNQGIKDQLMALRWIKDNIEEFGGDTESITIFGESAGARSVDLHLLSPHEKLFDKAILQSCSILNPGWVTEPDLKAPLKLAESLGLHTTDIEEALTFLSKADTHHVVAATSARADVDFKLCVEKEHENVENFIEDHPLNVNVSKAIDMKILLGYNSHEMLAIYVNRNKEFFDNLNVFYDKIKLAFEFSNPTFVEMENIVRNFYTGDEVINADVTFQLTDFDSDVTYVHPTVRNIDRYLQNGAKSIFYYVFSYNGTRNYVKSRINITVGGAIHADERGYLFDVELFSGETTNEDQKVIDAITTLWTNFAKFGDPTPVSTELLPVKWKPITKDSVYHYLNIDLELSTGMRPFHQRMSFWDLLYTKYKKYQKSLHL